GSIPAATAMQALRTSTTEEHFTSLGYHVDVAHHGAAALILAAARRPDAVLLDIDMPEVSGEEVLDRLHALDRSVPIVMLTGNADADLARRFYGRAPSITSPSRSSSTSSSAWWP